jgi:hypothetical protein
MVASIYAEAFAALSPTQGASLRASREAPAQFSPAGKIAYAGVSIPVWRLTAPAGILPAFDCKFVRYADMPAEMARAFREQQVLAGKPFDGAAYLEDFQLFADLRK